MTIPYRVHDSVNSTRFSCFLCRVVSSVHDISSVLWCPLRFLRKQFFWFQITMSATISTYTLFSVRLYSHLYLSGFMFYFCYCIQYYLWTTYGMSAHQHWFFPGTPASSTNEADRHDIDEILLKVELNTITLISLYEL
jgi:hypothetical protein